LEWNIYIGKEKPELIRFFVLEKDNHSVLQSKCAFLNDLKKDIQLKTFLNEAFNEGLLEMMVDHWEVKEHQ
jgi:hypothetical protein